MCEQYIIYDGKSYILKQEYDKLLEELERTKEILQMYVKDAEIWEEE